MYFWFIPGVALFVGLVWIFYLFVTHNAKGQRKDGIVLFDRRASPTSRTNT
jgi:hypothetical protein